MNRFFVSAALAGLVGLAACDSEPLLGPNGLAVQSIDRRPECGVLLGDSVTFLVVTKNVSTQPIDYDPVLFGLNVEVRDESGDVVYEGPVPGPVFVVASAAGRIEPGEETVWEVTWNLLNQDGEPVPVGPYTVVLELGNFAGPGQYLSIGPSNLYVWADPPICTSDLE